MWIFSNFAWDSSLVDFDKYNLFYGWNWTGKTTLTKLFSSLENCGHTDYADMEYKIEGSDDNVFDQHSPFTTKVRVFNQEFIDKNMEFVWTKAEPILILWEENTELQKMIETNEWALQLLREKLAAQQATLAAKKSEKDRFFTDVARIIWENIVWVASRNYRKPDAEVDFQWVQQKCILSGDEIDKLKVIIHQDYKGELNDLDFVFDLTENVSDMGDICKQTIQSRVIQRLKQFSDISDWVEAWVQIHKDHDLGQCEFCGNVLSTNRFDELLSHFSTEDKNFKEEIDKKIVLLSWRIEKLEKLIPDNKALLYQAYQDEYASIILTFESEKINFMLETKKLIEILKEKKHRTSEAILYSLPITNNLLGSVEQINEIIAKHNQSSKNYKIQKDDALKALKIHHLSEISDPVKKLELEIRTIQTSIADLNQKVNDLATKLLEDRKMISSHHTACGLINSNLNTFLGRDEICFEVASQWGYLIKRGSNLAKNLSDGEKTAIAFIFFIVSLKESGFNISDSIIVIDDPVSSLDSNCLFQAYSFLKNSVEDAHQVFLMTHNYDFLKLMLGWLNNYYRGVRKKPYYMVDNIIETDKRVAKIKWLDPLLLNHETEYHYLFKKLYEFESDNTIINVYHMPNVARKVLDTFLMFRVPNWEPIYQKLRSLNFDANKKTAIYKFTNDQSHITGSGFDPSLVPEAKKNIKYLLEMIETVFPEHYQILIDSI